MTNPNTTGTSDMTVTDLSARRWQTTDRTDKLKPVDALREAIRLIESGEAQVSHVIVCMGHETKDGIITDWAQAGTFSGYAQAGLLDRVKLGMMMDAMGSSE